MRTAASYLPNPVTGAIEAADRMPTAKRLARRALQRRQMLGLVGASYVIDAVILLLYAWAGSVPATTGPVFGICGLASVGCFIAMSEAGINDRFQDHYFVVQQSIVSLAIMLAFAWLVPEAGMLFLCTLFVVFSFSALRSTPRQTAIMWTATALGLAALFLLTDRPIAIPHQTYLERFITMVAFALTIGRCMFLGIFASSLRESLYKRGVQLKEAYRRIEELAELDELTGAFNRRCIMRML
ncbi:MAG TPA: GGDEF domain-containing protein, partial [Bradyrhizobium sp.]|nr:GGDEF domain-containing protein [Bradyrhizobium sp.]